MLKKIILSTILTSFAFSNNYSLNFDGVDDYVEIPKTGLLNLDGQSTFTIQVHIKNDALPGSPTWRQLISNTGTTTSCGLGDNGGYNIRYGADGGSGPYAHSFAFAVPEKNCFTAEDNMVYEEWQELTIVYVGSELHFYYDGIFVGSHSVEGSGNYLEYDGNMLIGKGTDGNMGNLFFPGNFDNLRIWQQALSQSEILSYLNSGMPTGDEEGLVGYWNFNEGEGSILTDLSGNGNDGVIYGATWSSDAPNDGPLVIDSFDEGLSDDYGYMMNETANPGIRFLNTTASDFENAQCVIID